MCLKKVLRNGMTKDRWLEVVEKLLDEEMLVGSSNHWVKVMLMRLVIRVEVFWNEDESFPFFSEETSSAYVCNDAMNVSCNFRVCDLCDENNLFIFDDESVRISPVSKMPFRKKPRDSLNKVYYVEGLGHNLFSVGKFCDKDLEVAFRNSTCFVRNEDGVDLLTGDRSSNLYTIDLNEVASNSSTCLLAKASSSQSWLWHQCLSYLNFATINYLVKNNLVQGLPKMKFKKDHLCSTCEQGKKHHKSKMDFASNKPLCLLHMDLCGPMHVESINGKRYVLVVIDDYSRYTWVFFLHSKDEASDVIISFIKKTQVNLQLQVQRVRTDNGTEFKNKTLAKFFDEAEAIVIACFTQNYLIIHKHFDKTPYELMNKRKPNIKFFRVFGCRCYLLNDYEDVGKLKAKGDTSVFVGYSKESLLSKFTTNELVRFTRA
nr:retrovirus-related Pol polyprotein from transposon TNT 1-94 [Tanacetum cinerariifolium]